MCWRMTISLTAAENRPQVGSAMQRILAREADAIIVCPPAAQSAVDNQPSHLSPRRGPLPPPTPSTAPHPPGTPTKCCTAAPRLHAPATPRARPRSATRRPRRRHGPPRRTAQQHKRERQANTINASVGAPPAGPQTNPDRNRCGRSRRAALALATEMSPLGSSDVRRRIKRSDHRGVWTTSRDCCPRKAIVPHAGGG